MPFTDDDLQKLHDNNCYGLTWLPGLLERLEAAEKVIYIMGSDPISGKVGKAYEAWLKASGKSSPERKAGDE